MNPYTRTVNHYSTEAIQDNEGGGTDIEWPTFGNTAMAESYPTQQAEQDLVNELMEENRDLRRQLKERDEKLDEALGRNLSLTECNESMAHETANMKDDIRKLTAELRTNRHESKESEYDREDKGATQKLCERNEWLQRETGMLREQLEYVQGRLRHVEINQTVRDDPEWTCNRCTLVNSGDAGTCKACGKRGPKRYPKHQKLECDGFM